VTPLRDAYAPVAPLYDLAYGDYEGDIDFYLNLAVYDFQEMLKSTTNPHYEAEFTYGRPMKGHSWHATNFADMIREMSEQVKRNTPTGESKAWSEY